ncbi:hypothetical protein ASPVEDRAFT_140116 [Aspergillus versicolor CBS 583.65]|uniref:Major facilitator superfamily (MFS) profile domain-containing protein n=1 Tax=Aspergillus versicolor CBS 583.65 TaxID=1036611 RepID=A0A1L9PYS5_ASPVE|nr:uncharacterized protein ASPVEDRAFT_140116 [Aspergillus versicolor CBS 583.65]OJJ06615.1 hypothetical protein ASPVEDRAFT_140116 [Aspergillus versicolor CBS 583.65]
MGEKDEYPGAQVQDTQHVETSSSTGPTKEDAELAKEWSRDVKGDEESLPASKKLHNPLAGLTREQLLDDVERFAASKQLEHILPDLRKGALIAQDPKLFETLDDLSEEEKELIRREKTHRWSQPFMMYFMTILCAGSAIVQGMDQTAVNGAQEYYFEEFGVTDTWIQGLVNGAPYLCSCLIGCWTTAPLNRHFGRRGCIFISCFVSFAATFWMCAAHTWWNLFLGRFLLGLAVGAKSTTTPVYAAECAPASIRGALAMQWQMWTAFGIMLGYIASVAFMDVPSPANLPGLNWRLMFGVTAIPPMLVCAQVYFCPESPRWYMIRNRYQAAYDALCKFRPSKLQAARDLYYIHTALIAEEKMREGKQLWREMFTVPRNRRAAQSSFFVMFMQQFCGVNAIMYYSSSMFRNAGFDLRSALLVSLGCGITNWIFALPAVYTIDTFGRRNLLLTTFPLMSIFLFWTGFSFWIEDLQTRTAMVATGIYLFMIVYSPGEGPVPFTYSAEAFPLYIRDMGMSFATATTWGFNFIVSLTWPSLNAAFTSQGAFGWYAAWNFFGWVTAYFCLPETKALSLEELDQVFSVPTRTHIKHYMDMLPWYFKKWVLRADVPPQKQLYEYHH